jgi:hypothetical protein
MANDVPQTSEPLASADVSLDAERLDAYRVAVEFQVLASGLLPRKQWPVLRDQLERASVSIALNTAEAAGRVSPADKAHFFAMPGAARWSPQRSSICSAHEGWPRV